VVLAVSHNLDVGVVELSWRINNEPTGYWLLAKPALHLPIRRLPRTMLVTERAKMIKIVRPYDSHTILTKQEGDQKQGV
jgi:hypothetical protein